MPPVQKPKTIFFGSGPVALKSLKKLLPTFDIEAVVTKPATFSVMQKLTSAPTYTVSTKAELDALLAKRPFTTEFAILVDFGVIVSKKAIDYFPKGIINSHFSLLPEWRGADPITFSILSGQVLTGVSLMLLSEAMDEGPLLAQAEYRIPRDATTPVLTEALINLSDGLLQTVVPSYIAGEIQPMPQPNKSATYSRKLTKEDGRLDWDKSADELERQVRAFIEWPKSFAELAGREVILTEVLATDDRGRPGSVSTDRHRLLIHCKNGSLEVVRLKPAGKQEMTASAFLAGYSKLIA